MANRKRTTKKILDNCTSGRKFLQDPKIVEKKFRRDLTKITRGREPLMEKEVYRCIDWIREGKSLEYCTELLRKTINVRTKKFYNGRFVENIVTTANQLIILWYKNQIYKVEKLHIARYNEMIVDLMNKKYPIKEEKPWIADALEGKDLLDVLQAMKQKEILLGMHRKAFKVTINNQTNYFLENEQKKAIKKEKIDISKLTFEEQVELLDLIKLSSKTDNEVHGVMLKEKIEEVEYEEVEQPKEESKNIEKIEQFKNNNYNNHGKTLEQIQRLIKINNIKHTD